MVGGLFEMQFACEIKKKNKQTKIMLDRKMEYSPSTMENNRGVTNAYSNILEILQP